MKCKKCGSQLKDSSNFCRFCGTAVVQKGQLTIQSEKEDVYKGNVQKNELTNSLEDETLAQSRLQDGKTSDKKVTIEDDSLLSDELSNDEKGLNHSKKSFVTVLLILLLFISFGFLYYFWTVIENNHKQISELKKENSKLTSIQEKNASEKETDKSISLFNFDGYLIDNDGDYSVEDGAYIFSKDDYTIQMSIDSTVKYQDISENLSNYKKYFTDLAYQVNSYGTKVVNSREFIVYELLDAEQNYILVSYAQISEEETVGFVVKFKDNKINYDSLSVLDDFIHTLNKSDQGLNNVLDIFMELQ